MDGYPGDYDGDPPLEWAPTPEEPTPSPGEVVWAHVPDEEDPSQGRDRAVLLIGRDGPWLLALQMTSHSEASVNRVIRVDPAAVRRDGAVLDEERFVAVAAAVRAVTTGRQYDDDPA